MTIKEFIEAAIQGGWYFESWHNPVKIKNVVIQTDGTYRAFVEYNEQNEVQDEKPWFRQTLTPNPFLDPEAWKAVGKVKGWMGKKIGIPDRLGPKGRKVGELQMLEMVEFLWREGSLEEYIATL